jgi:hypothetical protein
MTSQTAQAILSQLNAQGDNFFALNTDSRLLLLEKASEYGYRVPRNANGSTSRYFHAYLLRAARKEN